MSVIIHGVDKPKRCTGCVLMDRSTQFWGNCKAQEKEYATMDEQYKNCPMEECDERLRD